MEKTKAPRGAKPLPTPISKHELESLPIPKTREDLLKRIAERGFEVGYAANLNFATHDIADKVPVVISFVSMAVGILAFVSPVVQLTGVAVCLTLLGILTLYIEKYPAHEYGERGKHTLSMLYALEALYYKVKEKGPSADLSDDVTKLREIEDKFVDSTCPRQILFATWYAYFKFFAEKDYDWIDEQLHFRFWRDKVPATLKVLLVLAAVVLTISAIVNWPVWTGWFR
jgi:hypothetical protein